MYLSRDGQSNLLLRYKQEFICDHSADLLLSLIGKIEASEKKGSAQHNGNGNSNPEQAAQHNFRGPLHASPVEGVKECRAKACAIVKVTVISRHGRLYPHLHLLDGKI